MLRLTSYDTTQDDDQPESLLFPTEAVRRLHASLSRVQAGRVEEMDSIRRAEEALERVESDFARLRRQFAGDDDRPWAA